MNLVYHYNFLCYEVGDKMPVQTGEEYAFELLIMKVHLQGVGGRN